MAEIHAALDWLQAKARRMASPGAIVLSGWSAGGHLVGACVGHPAVAAGLAISGVFELAPIRDTYLNDKLQLTEAELQALSPLRQPMVRKPMAIAYGSGELPELRRQSRKFHARARRGAYPGALVRWPAPTISASSTRCALRMASCCAPRPRCWSIRMSVPDVFALPALAAFHAAGGSPVAVAEAALARIAAWDDPALFLARVPPDAVRARAAALAAEGPRGRALYGVPFVVKDNIDVAGMPTTAACPDYRLHAGSRTRPSSPGCWRPAPCCSARPTSTSSPPG